MRGERHTSPGEPCLTPIKMASDKNLLADARQGNLQQMRKRMRSSIFKKVEDINQRDERSCTPLHYAAKNSNIEMIRFILEKGGDLKATDKHGWSVLQYAVRYASEDTVDALIEAGADIFHREKKGWNCLHLAARNGQPEKARQLLEHGANVNDAQDQGWNALHLAVRYGQPDTITTLLEYGIDINAGNRGWTALHLAALNGHTDIASILINKSADMGATNAEGKTALDIAREEGHDRIVAIILEREFQTCGQTEDVLPSPPPTPPSAPTLQQLLADGATSTADRESLSQWREKIKDQLDRVDDDENHEAEKSDEQTAHDESSENVTITWKSLEEETKELMKQLENLRVQEVTKIKKAIVSARDEHSKQTAKLDKQKKLLKAQVDVLNNDTIPTVWRDLGEAERAAEDMVTEIGLLIENSKEETAMIGALKSHLVENRFSAAAADKARLVAELQAAQKLEVQQLEDELRQTQGACEMRRQRAEADATMAREKVRVLEAELDNVARLKSLASAEHETALDDLGKQLEKAERQTAMAAVGGAGPEKDEHWFGCPVCMVLLKPPMRIFQCPEGHILCDECKENPAMVHCPQCRVPLEGQCSRNRALEEVARSYFPMAPSETL